VFFLTRSDRRSGAGEAEALIFTDDHAHGTMHAYKVRPRKDHRGFDLISDALPFGRLWYGEPDAVANAIGYATHSSRSHDAVIRVYDAFGNLIQTHEHKGDFREF
jgi:hypothetical protein